MSQREWLEHDFYKELGVASSATLDDIKKAYRKLARELHPDANPGNTEAEARFKRVSEAHSVLADPDKRREYDETRRMYASAGNSGRGYGSFTNGGRSTSGTEFNFDDLFGSASSGSASSHSYSTDDLGDLFGGLFNRGGFSQTSSRTARQRPTRGQDLETETTLPFRDATKGVTTSIKLTSPSACTTCHGSGAQPGTSPRTCPRCEGRGFVDTSQGHFGFSEPCSDCGGTGSLIEHPCVDCGGSGVTTRTRTVNVRVPAGLHDGQKIRLPGQGQAGLRGAPSGDLYVKIHITPDPIFGRDETNPGNLTVSVPVSYPELVLGTTVSVPTLDGHVTLRIAPGTPDGQTLRVRGRGVPPKGSAPAGDLLVTVAVTVPKHPDEKAKKLLEQYAEAERESGFDPRAGWAGA